MDVGTEAVFVGGMAMHALLRSLGVEPDVMIGHSSGESAALAASGAVPATTPRELAAFMRQLNAVYERVLAEGKIPTGALLAVGALPAETVQAQIAASGGDVVVAMDNCANQLVLYGAPDAIAAVQKALAADGAHLPAAAVRPRLPHPRLRRRQRRLPRLLQDDQARRAAGAALLVRVAPASSPSGRARCASSPPRSGRPKVRFRETVSRCTPTACGCFVEVGPSGNLTAFVNDILTDQAQSRVATNVRRATASSSC